jgi:hypothetical protein
VANDDERRRDAALIRILEQSRPRERQRKLLTPKEHAARRRLVPIARRKANAIIAAQRAERQARMQAQNDCERLDFEAAQARTKKPGWEEALEYARNLMKRRMLRSDELHVLIRKFVATYIATADPKNFDGDIEPGERKDLIRGARLKTSLREKWAVLRAAEYFGRDERTIREAIKPSRRSRRRHRT